MAAAPRGKNHHRARSRRVMLREQDRRLRMPPNTFQTRWRAGRPKWRRSIDPRSGAAVERALPGCRPSTPSRITRRLSGARSASARVGCSAADGITRAQEAGSQVRPVRWASDTRWPAIENMRVDHRGADVAMTKKLLDGSEVAIVLQAHSRPALGYLRASAQGSSTPPAPCRRSWPCCFLTRSRCVANSTPMMVGSVVIRSWSPLPARRRSGSAQNRRLSPAAERTPGVAGRNHTAGSPSGAECRGAEG